MSQDTKKPNFHVNPHIVILSVIVFVFAVVVFRLYKWNKGVPTNYDPASIQSDDYDIETLDVIFPLLSGNSEGHEDDGVTTILCLGNDPFSQNKSDKNGLAELIASKTGATVYNGSFPGSCVTPANASYNDNDWIDAFSMPYLSNAICDGDFTNIKTVAEAHGDADFISTIEMLEELDMNTVDIICIMYDGSDYINQRGSDDPNNPYSIVSYSGALNYAISGIKETYPFIRIVIMSHTFCLTPDGENADKVDLGNGTLSHYLLKEIDVAEFNGVSIIDNFYGTINEDNYSEYMTDYIHFNDKGRELLAQRFVDCIFDEE